MAQAEGGRDYLSFTIDGELFAADVSAVREVLGATRITRLPNAIPYMKGIINLRGSSVPVVDLRVKFGLAARNSSEEPSIVVIELSGAAGRAVVGALVDEVHEVLQIADASIEAAPRFGTRLSTSNIKGVARRNESFIVLLDVERIFSEEQDTEAMQEANE